jgi:hypothetical protein
MTTERVEFTVTVPRSGSITTTPRVALFETATSPDTSSSKNKYRTLKPRTRYSLSKLLGISKRVFNPKVSGDCRLTTNKRAIITGRRGTCRLTVARPTISKSFPIKKGL